MRNFFAKIGIVLIFLLISLSNFSDAEASDGDVCQQVTISKQTSLSQNSGQLVSLNSTTNIILPLYPSITIHIPKAANSNLFTQNIAYKYGLYATAANKSGWVLANNNSDSLLAANENSEEITFTIDTGALIENENNKEKVAIIPRTNDNESWRDQGMITFKIPQRPGSLEKESGLPTLCTFSLHLTNQCSAYEGFSLKTTPSGFVFQFGKSNSFLQGPSNSFQFSRGLNDSSRVTVPRTLSSSDGYVFGINKSEAPDYFTGTTPVILYQNTLPICETTFVPDNSDFQKSRSACSITPEKVGSSFSGNLKIQNIPSVMLNAQGDKWLNVSTTEEGNIQAGIGGITSESIIPKVVVVPTDLFSSFSTSNEIGINGIQILAPNNLSDICSDPRNCLFVPPPGGISVLPPLDREKDYTAFVMFKSHYYKSVNNGGSIPSIIADETQYYLVPQCSYKFYWGKNGFEDKGKIDDKPIEGSSDQNKAPKPELKDICSSIPHKPEDSKENLQSYASCTYCTSQGKSYTAIGCIPTDLPSFLHDYLFTVGLSFAGGIAFLLMLWGGFNILISQGDAHKIQMGREIIVSAGIGLLFIIFSIVILQFIGKDIIGLPIFGK